MILAYRPTAGCRDRCPPILAAPTAASLRRRRATLDHGAFAVRVRILPGRGDRGGSRGRHGCRCSAMGHLRGRDRLYRSWLLGDPSSPEGGDAGSRPAGRSRCLSAFFADLRRSRCGRRQPPRGREARTSGAHPWVRILSDHQSLKGRWRYDVAGVRRDGGTPNQNPKMRFPVVFLRRFAQNAHWRAANDAQSLRPMNRNNCWSIILRP